jgi:hypothetical protein
MLFLFIKFMHFTFLFLHFVLFFTFMKYIQSNLQLIDISDDVMNGPSNVSSRYSAIKYIDSSAGDAFKPATFRSSRGDKSKPKLVSVDNL